MNYDPIILEFKPLILESLQKLTNENVDMNITAVKKITNSIITDYFKGTKNSNINSTLMNINGMFSGRGKAWARIDKSSRLYNEILNTLSSTTSNIDTTNLVDLFEEKGFAWLRFGGTNRHHAKFNLRYNGSKLEDAITFKVQYEDIDQIKNLEGVPHKLGLESGIFEKEANKEKDQTEIDTSELNNFGIFKLEDIIGEM